MNGPEVLSKFVGETEKNVRDLFADAEADQRAQGKSFGLSASLLLLILLQYFDIYAFLNVLVSPSCLKKEDRKKRKLWSFGVS